MTVKKKLYEYQFAYDLKHFGLKRRQVVLYNFLFLLNRPFHGFRYHLAQGENTTKKIIAAVDILGKN